jgi:eukaryotic-like serine/threonine-protein kinase
MAGTLAQRYELGDRLGVGGMSTVLDAFDRRLERHVAVKLLAEHLAEDPQFVSRFRREALAAARLVHPNVVQVFDFGLDEPSGRHYIVMELVRGKSGAELLREEGRLPVGEAVDLVAQSCLGLDYAHRNGVVHRDVKPGNLLRSTDGVVKLADFGIAKAAATQESQITQVGSVLGTASYLAPEQARGEEAGPQADLYALGVVTYQLLSGRLPYEAASLTELALKQQREAPAWLHELDPQIPQGLSEAVDRALALDVSERPSSAGDLREELLAGAGGAVADATMATRITRPATSATRIAPLAAAGAGGAAASFDPGTQRHDTAARAPRAPRAPRPEPAYAGSVAEAPAARRDARPDGRRTPSAASRVRRLLLGVVVLALIVAAIAIAITVANSGGSGVDLRDVNGDSVSQLVQELRGLVQDNTR